MPESSSEKLDSSSRETLSGKATPTKQHLTVSFIIACILAVLHSFNIGWLIGGLNVTKIPLICYSEISGKQYENVSAVYGVGGIVGGILSNVFVERIGRRNSLLAINIFWILSGSLQASGYYACLIAGRIIGGIAAGIACAAAPMYVSETAPLHLRGVFGVMHQLFVTLGILLSCVLPYHNPKGITSPNPAANDLTLPGDCKFFNWNGFDYKTMAIVTCVFPVIPAVIHFCGAFFFPESPSYLYKKGKSEEAEKAARIFFGKKDVSYEMEVFREEKEIADSNKGSFKDNLKIIVTVFRFQLLIGVVLQIAQQFSGINAIMFFSAKMFKDAGYHDYNLAAIITNTVNVAMTFVALPLIEKSGRRFLCLFGFGFMAFLHIIVTVTLNQSNLNNKLNATSGEMAARTASIVFIMLVVAFFSIGPGPVPWLIGPELFPTRVRGEAVSICVLTNWVFTVIVTFGYPPLDKLIHEFVFIIFAVLCAATTAFAFFFIPETKGKSIEEITAMFDKSGRGVKEATGDLDSKKQEA